MYPNFSYFISNTALFQRKLQFLLYENQSFQDELRQAQKKLLQVSSSPHLKQFITCETEY